MQPDCIKFFAKDIIIIDDINKILLRFSKCNIFFFKKK